MPEGTSHVLTQQNVALIVSVSAESARSLQLTADGPLAGVSVDIDRFTALIHPEDRGFFEQTLGWVGTVGSSARIGLRLARLDGRWTPVLANIQAAGAGLEIAIKDDDDGARRSQAQVRHILESAQHAMVVRVGGRVAFSNNALAQMLGYRSLAQLRAQGSMADHVHPEDRAMVNGRIAARAAGRETPENYEFRMIRTDGSVLWVDSIVSRITWKGEPASMAWLIDITERKRTEEALRRSEKLFGTVFQACPDLLVLSRADDGRIVNVNDSFERNLGYARDQIVGRTEREVGIFLDAGVPGQLLASITDPAAPREVMAAVRTRTGEHRQHILSAQPIRFAERDLVLTVGRDVTDRFRVEEEVRQSREAAVFANRAKSEFLANMSHELRTPLNAIIGFSEVIAKELFGPVGNTQYADYARDICSSGEHLLQIINDLLDLSKLEAGKQALAEAEIALDELVASSLRLMRERARSAGLTLAVDLPVDLPAVFADERLLKQILINLLSNAVKFTETGGRITVRGRLTGEGGVELAVADTGIGMTATEIETALSPFGQVDSRLARTHQGTGLGLPLVRSLAELHDGTVHVRSEPDVGTTVTVTLPASRVMPAAA